MNPRFLRHLLYLSSGSLYPTGFSCTWVCPYSVSFAWFPFCLTSKEWTSSDLVLSLLLSINILLVVELINPNVLNIFYIQMIPNFRFVVLTYPLPPPALHWFTDGLLYTSTSLCNKVLKISTSKIKPILLFISSLFFTAVQFTACSIVASVTTIHPVAHIKTELVSLLHKADPIGMCILIETGMYF